MRSLSWRASGQFLLTLVRLFGLSGALLVIQNKPEDAHLVNLIVANFSWVFLACLCIEVVFVFDGLSFRDPAQNGP